MRLSSHATLATLMKIESTWRESFYFHARWRIVIHDLLCQNSDYRHFFVRASSCYFVDRLLSSPEIAIHEITRTNPNEAKATRVLTRSLKRGVLTYSQADPPACDMNSHVRNRIVIIES